MHLHRSTFLAALALLGLMCPATAQNAPLKCSNHMITGTYGFTCNGVAPPFAGAATTIPVALIGIVMSDGAGSFRGPATASFNGYFVDEYLTTDGGQKSELNSDCTGTIEYRMWIGPPNAVDSVDLGLLPINFVVIDNGNEIMGLPTSAGYTLTCHLVRMRQTN